MMRRAPILLGWMIGMGITLLGAEPLVFGVMGHLRPDEVSAHFEPLRNYLEQHLGTEIRLATERSYEETLNSFISGKYDFGLILPSSYVMAQRRSPGVLQPIAGVELNHKSTIQAAIVVRKDAPANSLKELNGTEFAFGSCWSALSYYLPYYLLHKEGVLDQLKSYHTLGDHDTVAKQVILGTFDAGAVTPTVGHVYSGFLKTLGKSIEVNGPTIVVHRSIDPKLADRLQGLFLNLHDRKILKKVQPSLTGFVLRKDADFNRLREIIDIVDRQTAGICRR